MFTELLTAVGSDALFEIVGPALTDNVHKKTQAALHEEIINLIVEDPQLLEHMLNGTRLKAENPELMFTLVERALRAAPSAQAQGVVMQLAEKMGLDGRLRLAPSVDLRSCTASQRNALRHLRAMAEIYFEGGMHRGVSLRTNMLMVAPSGSGKNYTATTLGRLLGLPVLRLTVGDWMVAGSKVDTCTLETLRDHLDAHPRSIIMVDEIDKFRAVPDSAWSQGQLAELYGVLDRDVSYRSKTHPWTDKHTDRMRTGVFIIGSGTWQNVWSEEAGAKMGFNATETPYDIERAVRKAGVIPAELINRFADGWVMMAPYTEADFARLATSLDLGPDILDPKTAAASGLNYRYVESALTNHALRQRLARLEIPPQPVLRSQPVEL